VKAQSVKSMLSTPIIFIGLDICSRFYFNISSKEAVEILCEA
jgi:hypothetical protein